ncbi:inositol monophosphatase [Bradyrhizobium sp. WYCCWR 13023]|uniref:Inositol-1-monophosphatase n=1 Tax=Bradyrhizobium zhengyangense TaxID=2911009 RepID=A0A9X1UER4_9BRAD|nr:inositol monophosphatase family protein [Bradyrhizobium zhengyangense]MCG2625682.1 inositol monophosphatase [Bradyrhizobium zhengyangense]MCG2638296.1 inositol monophosphatase [Bradyrhizobium zhengyangense]MCG2666695.1 inositol monophosphatase [Bradyrhizobium zhengyangense]
MTPAELMLRRYAAQGLAAEAGRIALDYFGRRESLGVTMKGTQDWLTVADGAVEDFLRARLSALFPGDTVIGEEGGGEASDAVWILDPIDGTANFAHGDRNWCISIGFLLDRQPTIGIVSAPSLGELYVAQRDEGATLNGQHIVVSGADDISRACIELGWSPRIPSQRYLDMISRGYAAGCSIKRAGSGTLGLCNVANGRTEGYAELHINAWDVAAGIVIVSEAGGWVSDFFAGDGISKGNPILCCVPALASQLSDITGIT